jgi:hypothetical protein
MAVVSPNGCAVKKVNRITAATIAHIFPNVTRNIKQIPNLKPQTPNKLQIPNSEYLIFHSD